jgi:hypothetical protein
MRLTARRAGLTLLGILGSVRRGGRRRRSARLVTAPELSPEKLGILETLVGAGERFKSAEI